MEDKSVKVILPMTMLDNKLIQTVEREIDNRKLKSDLNTFFIKCGLTARTVNKIFNDELADKKNKKSTINLLSSKEKVVLATGLQEFLPYKLGIDLENFYKEQSIKKYLTADENFKYIPEEFIAKNCLKENETTFCFLLSFKETIEYIQNGVIEYLLDIQREPEYRLIGKCKVAVPMIDENATESIKKSMWSNTFENNTIILAYKTDEENNEDKFVSSSNPRIGTFKAPKMYINDGAHRITSSIKFSEEYYNKKNKWPDRYFQVKIVVADEDRSKRITRETFLRTDISPEFSNTLKRDLMNDLIKEITNKSDYLNEATGKTFEEYKHFNMRTTRKVLQEGLEECNIDLNNKGTFRHLPKKIADSLDILLSKLDDIESCKKFMDEYYNIYGALILHAYKSIELNAEEIDNYDNLLINKIKGISLEDIKNLKLGLKVYNKNNILTYFNVF